MRMLLAEVPRPVIERLKAVQAQPSSFDCYYRPEGGRGGAISGIVFAALGALALVAGALATELPLPVTLLGGIACGGILWSSIARIRRYGAAELKPMTILNPLSFARVTLDHLTVHDLWAELKDLKIVHHHTNGVYTHTQFEFKFGKQQEMLFVSPKAKAEALADRIESYRQRLLAAVDGQADPGDVFGHDLFLELRLPGGQLRQAPPAGSSGAGRRAALAWGVGGGCGAFLGAGLFLVSYVAAQDRSIDHCYSIDSCAGYFERWSLPLRTSRARRKLAETYRKEWERNKTSIRALRQMKKLERAEHLTPAQEKEILALYRDGSEKELRALFQGAIDKYVQLSAGADPRARQAIQRLLELARDKGYYRTRVTYQGVTERVQGPITLPPSARGRTLVPMGPSFTPELNRSREAMITERIQRAFVAILPQDLLEFEGLERTSGTGYGSYRGRYGSGYGGYTPPRALAAAVAAGSAPTTTPAELEFQVSYVVFPSTSVYVNRNDPFKVYMGVGFDWIVNIKVKAESLYLLKQQSYPPPRFSVSSYRSRYAPSAGLAAGTIYSTMAGTAFDDFSRNLVRHFGIGAQPIRSPTALPAGTPTGIRPGIATY